jgi:hypothetical protein
LRVRGDTVAEAGEVRKTGFTGSVRGGERKTDSINSDKTVLLQ